MSKTTSMMTKLQTIETSLDSISLLAQKQVLYNIYTFINSNKLSNRAMISQKIMYIQKTNSSFASHLAMSVIQRKTPFEPPPDKTNKMTCTQQRLRSAWATSQSDQRGARWLSGRVSDFGARGPGFETYRRRVVSLSKTLYSPKVLVNYPGSDGSVPT